ncbi:MAG TPA: tyrosine-protein phosphatase [Polyangiaceae bacterium]|nr:tyrosine-protein phosphatase [Polyangiaceae bacterium]
MSSERGIRSGDAAEPTRRASNASRLPTLPGLVNFRDVGGKRAAEGWIAAGRLFRTAHLSHLDEASAQRLGEELGIRQYIDFRADFEIERDGPPQQLLTRGVGWQRHPFDIADPTFRAVPLPAPADWSGMYSRALPRLRTEISSVIDALARAEGPVVFGCWAGKDRTGIVAALVLSLLGVDDVTIAEDYEATSAGLAVVRERFAFLWQERPSDADAIFTAFGEAPPEVVLAFLRDTRAAFGDVEQALTVAPDTVAELRARYLVAEAPDGA